MHSLHKGDVALVVAEELAGGLAEFGDLAESGAVLGVGHLFALC